MSNQANEIGEEKERQKTSELMAKCEKGEMVQLYKTSIREFILSTSIDLNGS